LFYLFVTGDIYISASTKTFITWNQYSTIWRSDDETLYFKTNKEAAAHFNLHSSTVSICVKKQKYKRFYVEKQGTGGS